jgi:hypothetical protein
MFGRTLLALPLFVTFASPHGQSSGCERNQGDENGGGHGNPWLWYLLPALRAHPRRLPLAAHAFDGTAEGSGSQRGFGRTLNLCRLGIIKARNCWRGFAVAPPARSIARFPFPWAGATLRHGKLPVR